MKKSVKRGLIVGIVVLIVGIIFGPRLAWLFGDEEAPAPVPKAAPSLPVEGIIAKYTTSLNGIRVTGSLIANEGVDLVTEIVGTVKGIYFEEGSKVEKASCY